ncbi:MAG: O-antigen ligase family protein [Chloroflexi bacterium]|nr:O-antigen ligase family protein [Chloroflexota bacterium]
MNKFFIPGARLAFAASIVLLPFRFRFTLLARPIGTIYNDYTDLLLFTSDLFVILTLALWTITRAREPNRISFGSRALTLAIFGLTAIAFVIAPFSIDPLLAFYHAIRLTLLGALYLFVINEITLGWIAIPAAIQIFIQATVGIAQVLRQHSIGLSWLGEYELDPAWRGVSIVWAEGVRSLRAYGLTDHPNILGGCFAFALLMLVAWRIHRDERWSAPIVAVFALGTLGLLITFSRAAYLAFGAGIGSMLILFFATKQTRALRDLIALIFAALVLIAPFVWHNANYLGVRLNAVGASGVVGADSAMLERGALNSAANRIFVDAPIFGIGVGALPQAMRARFPDFPLNYQPAHIALLNAAAETGIGGALFYALALIAPWCALWINRRRLNFSPALVGVSAALLAVTLIGFFDYYTWLLAPGRLWQWTIWGAWSALYRASFIGATHV